MAIAAILRRDHHWSGNFMQDGGEEIYPNGTEGSNPSCSSRQSVSRQISPSGIEKSAVAAVCAGPARRHGRQKHAGLVNITPTAGNVSVGPFSSTAVPTRAVRRPWLQWCAKRARGSDVTRL